MIRRNTTEQMLVEAEIGTLVAGFPKCGTTSFAEWLDTSDQVDVSKPKETFQLCPEFADNRQRSAHLPLHATFRNMSLDLLRVEATTLNVYSDALRRAVATLPHIKVIVLTRDPGELVISWHNQMCQAGLQLSDDFELAWQGAMLSEQGGPAIDFLQRYHHLFRMGYWIDLWIDSLGSDRVLVVDQSELNSAPSLQAKLNRFLDRELQLPAELPKRNAFSAIRFPLVYRLARNSKVKSLLARFERKLPQLGAFRRFCRDSVFLKQTNRKQVVNSDVTDWFSKDRDSVQQLLSESHARWSNPGDPSKRGMDAGEAKCTTRETTSGARN